MFVPKSISYGYSCIRLNRTGKFSAFTANTIGGSYIVAGSIGTELPVFNYDLTNITGVVLPVVIGPITAWAVNCKVQLQWKTNTELNAKGFTVKYSSNGTAYSNLATVAAKGNSAGTQAYSYTHESPAAGTGYYRIRQTDVNGKYTLGDVLAVINNCNASSITAYLNPVKDKLIVQIGGAGSQVLTVHDLEGRQIAKLSVNGGRYEINAKGWAKGLYTVTIGREGKVGYTLK